MPRKVLSATPSMRISTVSCFCSTEMFEGISPTRPVSDSWTRVASTRALADTAPENEIERTSTTFNPAASSNPSGKVVGLGNENVLPSKTIRSGSEVNAAPRMLICMSTVSASMVPRKKRDGIVVEKSVVSRATPSGPMTLGVVTIDRSLHCGAWEVARPRVESEPVESEGKTVRTRECRGARGRVDRVDHDRDVDRIRGDDVHLE